MEFGRLGFFGVGCVDFGNFIEAVTLFDMIV
jgi:hypothetical protein